MILKGIIVVITPLTFCFKLLNVWSLQQPNQRFALTAMQEKVAIYNRKVFFPPLPIIHSQGHTPQKTKHQTSRREEKPNPLAAAAPLQV